MGVMVREIYEAFLEAGASKATAGDAAVAVAAKTDLATTQDIGRLETQMAALRADFAERETRLVKWGVALVGFAVAAESFLDWVVN